MKSIQSKFLTLVISGMLILALSISALSVVYIKRILEDDSNIITESVANTEAHRINETLKEVEYSVKLMENYLVSTVNNADSIEDSAEREDICAKAKRIFYAIAENCDGASSFFLRFAPELTDGTVGFYLARSTPGASFLNIQTSDLSGYETDPSLSWFYLPKSTGAPVWIEPYSDAKTGTEVITYVMPVYVDYQFIGVVGIDYAFSKLTSMVSGISVYDNGFAYLEGADGSGVAFSPVDEHVLDRAHTDHGFAQEQKELRNGMTLVIHADYSDIQRDSYRVVSMIIIIVFVLLASFVIITYFLTRKIIRPLKNLTNAAELFSNGNFDVRIDSCDSRDEVGALARAFERTAVKMHGYTSYINALAYKDSLTGVKNRTAYNDFTNEVDVKMKLGECEPFAVLVADINGLKQANDKYGHEVGNKLIVKSAKVICDAFKHSPVFRVGGDEFAAILAGEDLENCARLLEEMDAVCRETFVSAGDTSIVVSVARAVAVYDRSSDASVEDVFNRADKQMYEHKREMRES